MGELAEFRGPPVVVECQKKLAHIQVNGITINNVEMPKQANQRATDQCENQMKLIDETRKLTPEEVAGRGIKVNRTTTCVLTLPDAKVNASDIVRVVYACHENEVVMASFKWTEKPKKIDEDGRDVDKVKIHSPTNTRGTKMTLSKCKIDDKIDIRKVLVVNQPATETYYGMFRPEVMNEECFKSKSSKASNKCSVRKKKGLKMQIFYACLAEDAA